MVVSIGHDSFLSCDRFFALGAREKCNMEVEEDVSLTSCYCQLNAEATDISKKG